MPAKTHFGMPALPPACGFYGLPGRTTFRGRRADDEYLATACPSKTDIQNKSATPP